jgi:hypothetical protein
VSRPGDLRARPHAKKHRDGSLTLVGWAAFKSYSRGYDSCAISGRYGRSQTDRMRDLCNTILDDWVLPVYNEEKNVRGALWFYTQLST